MPPLLFPPVIFSVAVFRRDILAPGVPAQLARPHEPVNLVILFSLTSARVFEKSTRVFKHIRHTPDPKRVSAAFRRLFPSSQNLWF